MTCQVPWSKKHKRVTRGAVYSLSNSFAQPLTNSELIAWAVARGDESLVEQYQHHSLAYGGSGGSLDLRTEIAKLYGPEIGADNVVVCSSCQMGLQLVASAVLSPGDHAISFSPGYQSVQMAPQYAGAEITRLLLRPENGWSIELDAVEAAIQPNTKYIVFNAPYNPAGTLISHDTQDRLKAIARQHGIYLGADEIYRFLEHDEKDRLQGTGAFYERGISIQGMSKSWGGCGISLGWIATRDKDLIEKILDLQYFGTTCQSRAAEIQAIMALRASEFILERNLEIIRHNLGLLDQFMADYAEYFSWVRPSAGATCFIEFKGPWPADVLGYKLAQAGISVKPAYVFSDAGEHRQYFRCGYGERIMPNALTALREFVENNKSSW